MTFCPFSVVEMSEDTPKGSTEPPDYEYGNVKLQYLPPPPELAEGQVYVKKSEFERRIHRGYAKYMKENPFVPLGNDCLSKKPV